MASARNKKVMIVKAVEFRCCYESRNAWKMWRERYNEVIISKKMNFVALSHWATNTTYKMFVTWKSKYIEECHLKLQLDYSRAVYNRKLALMVLAYWMKFLVYRREKNREKELAKYIRSNQIIKVYFFEWRRSLVKKQYAFKMEQNIVTCGERSIKRRYLQYFKSFIQYKRNKSNKHEAANLFYNTQIKRKYILLLKHYNTRKKLHTEQNNVALQHYQKMRMQSFINKWKDNLEEKEDEKMLPITNIARKFYRCKLKTNAVHEWIRYVKYKRRKKQSIDKAIRFHESKIIPRCFSQWIQYTYLQKDLLQIKDTSNAFYHNLLLGKYFFTWLKLYRITINIEEWQQIAISFNESTVKYKMFLKWKEKASIERNDMLLHVKSTMFYEKRLLAQMFKQWKHKKIVVDKRRQSECIADEFHQRNILLQPCWNSLKKYTSCNKRRRALEVKARNYYEMKLKYIVFNAIKCNLLDRRKLYVAVANMNRESNNILCRAVFSLWKQCVVELKLERAKLSISEEHHKRSIQLKALKTLKVFATARMNKRFNEDEAVIRAQLKLDKGCLKHTFHQWKLLTIEVASIKCQMLVAVEHYNTKLSRVYIKRWKLYIQIKHKKKIQQKLCMLFRTKYIEKYHWDIWKRMLHERRIAIGQFNQALWWWSYQLQTKVFRSFKEYTKSKKEKRLDYQSALIFRKNHMLEVGVVKWIQYATYSMDQRQKIAYNQQIEKMLEVQARVHRYALIWLNKTKARRKKVESDSRFSITFPIEETTALKPADMSKFKPFNVAFPTMKKRSAPRQPEYLRESYDLSKLKRKSRDHLDTVPRNHLVAPINQSKYDFNSDSHCLLELSEELVENESRMELLPPSSFAKGSDKGRKHVYH